MIWAFSKLEAKRPVNY